MHLLHFRMTNVTDFIRGQIFWSQCHPITLSEKHKGVPFSEACCYLVKNKTKQKSSANLRVARLASNRGNVLSIFQISSKSGIEKKKTKTICYPLFQFGC